MQPKDIVRSASVMLAMTTLLTTASAYAQDARTPRRFAVERFRPSMDGEGIMDVEWGATKDFLAWDVALWMNYANDPLVLRIDDGESGGTRSGPSLIKHRLGANLVGAVGLFPWLQVGIDLPVAIYQSAGNDLATIAENPKDLSLGGTGDLRVRPKFALLRSADHGVDMALITMVTMPTSSSPAYLGEKTVGFEPELVLSRAFAEARVSANVGYRVRQKSESLNLTVDDEITYRMGAAYPFQKGFGLPVEVSASLAGAVAASSPFKASNQSPLESLFGAAYDAHERLRVFAALGVGWREGFGTPDFRVVAGVRLHTPAELDRDEDGILDDVDECIDDPEDKDAWQDGDGCPDVDNDSDGILDVADGAPDDPEDVDEFEDEDGVPDPDNDHDGLLDAEDACPNEAGPGDNKGCPDADTDGDGIVDRLDGCVDVAEDKDEFEDADGCPDLDNDGDGLEDTLDRCPNEAGPVENAGCPDLDRDGDTVVDRIDNCPDIPGEVDFNGCAKPQKVRLTADRIEILEKVFFDSGKASIQERSFELLDSVSEVLMAHPEIAKISIEGHTDDRGSAEFNKSLSQQRADAVLAYLVGKGLDVARLVAKGLGEERPLSSNATSKGRAANRRVEFNIVNEPAADEGDGKSEAESTADAAADSQPEAEPATDAAADSQPDAAAESQP